MFYNIRIITLFSILLIGGCAQAAKIHIISDDANVMFKRPSSPAVRGFTLGLKADGSVVGDGVVTPVWNSVYESQNGPINEQIQPICRLEGRLDAEHGDITFAFTAKEDYLSPCGLQAGITMVCDGPRATCE